MARIIRVMLVLIAAVAAGGAIAMATPTRTDDDIITAIAVAVALLMMWIAARTVKEATAAEEQARKLERDKRVLTGFADWLSNGATKPQPVLRAVRRHRR